MTIEKWVKEEKVRLGRLRFAVLMHRKKKESLSHLRCREAAGVDSIAAGMILDASSIR